MNIRTSIQIVAGIIWAVAILLGASLTAQALIGGPLIVTVVAIITILTAIVASVSAIMVIRGLIRGQSKPWWAVVGSHFAALTVALTAVPVLDGQIDGLHLLVGVTAATTAVGAFWLYWVSVKAGADPFFEDRVGGFIALWGAAAAAFFLALASQEAESLQQAWLGVSRGPSHPVSPSMLVAAAAIFEIVVAGIQFRSAKGAGARHVNGRRASERAAWASSFVPGRSLV